MTSKSVTKSQELCYNFTIINQYGIEITTQILIKL